MKYIHLFLLLFTLFPSSIVFGQNETKKQIANFYYSLKYQKDSLDQYSVHEEIFLLTVNDKGSIFTSINNKKNDSLTAVIYDNYDKHHSSIVSFKGLPQTKFKYYILKKKNNDSIEVYDKIGRDNFVYTELNKINWKLSPEKKIFEGYQCQKAVAKIYGRTFIAWFTKEIALNDGPYKFGNLPGFIVEIYDEKKYYHFQLIGVTKNFLEDFKVPLMRKSKLNEIDRTKFLKGKQDYDHNIIGRIQTSPIAGDVPPERMKEIKENVLKNNNPLELR